MTATDAQIKSGYEMNGMTPQEIADDLKFDVSGVKAKLMQISSKYRKDAGLESLEVEDGLNFTNDQLKRINEQIFTNATSAALPDGSFDFKTSQRACEYIRDDKKGRKEVIRAVQNNTFNILDFNQNLQQARLAAQRTRALIEQPVKEAVEV